MARGWLETLAAHSVLLRWLGERTRRRPIRVRPSSRLRAASRPSEYRLAWLRRAGRLAGRGTKASALPSARQQRHRRSDEGRDCGHLSGASLPSEVAHCSEIQVASCRLRAARWSGVACCQNWAREKESVSLRCSLTCHLWDPASPVALPVLWPARTGPAMSRFTGLANERAATDAARSRWQPLLAGLKLM